MIGWLLLGIAIGVLVVVIPAGVLFVHFVREWDRAWGYR